MVALFVVFIELFCNVIPQILSHIGKVSINFLLILTINKIYNPTSQKYICIFL